MGLRHVHTCALNFLTFFFIFLLSICYQLVFDFLPSSNKSTLEFELGISNVRIKNQYVFDMLMQYIIDHYDF